MLLILILIFTLLFKTLFLLKQNNCFKNKYLVHGLSYARSDAELQIMKNV